MWKPPINFITLHWLIVIYPYGNMQFVDAYFFGVSASTESGLNPVVPRRRKVTMAPKSNNWLGFINIIVVVVRLYWFEKRLKNTAPALFRPGPSALRTGNDEDPEANVTQERSSMGRTLAYASGIASGNTTKCIEPSHEFDTTTQKINEHATVNTASAKEDAQAGHTLITFADAPHPRREPKALYLPSPREREEGQSVRELDDDVYSNDGEYFKLRARCMSTHQVIDDDDIAKAPNPDAGPSRFRRRRSEGRSIAEATSIERVASSMFVIGGAPSQSRARARTTSLFQQSDMPYLSSHATIGRNSQFQNLTKEDRELLGGLEYRALKLLLKIVVGNTLICPLSYNC
ncbi:hypothetical protein BDV95DRAFT_642773 [Massariosphaeria phaeospora]|uniref:Uncharacterized protein n=1 Tax=Massariosphaeria phaeospora TaxID=100035 RepID=A0A7C8M5D9_9PLEO|nr:hypothetical protein BDV95DRAFT_642773 [Massariosphaeria phaeospora]